MRMILRCVHDEAVKIVHKSSLNSMQSSLEHLNYFSDLNFTIFFYSKRNGWKRIKRL